MNAIMSPETGMALKMLPAHVRAILLAGALWMLNAGPERLLDAVKSTSLTSTSLGDNRQPVPASIDFIVRSLSDKIITRKRKKQDGIYKPRSKKR